MKKIEHVDPIQLVDRKGKPIEGVDPVTLYEYIEEHPLSDKLFLAGLKNIDAGLSVQAACRSAKGTGLVLDDFACQLLNTAITTPQPMFNNLSPEAARQFRPFTKTIEKAKDFVAK